MVYYVTGTVIWIKITYIKYILKMSFCKTLNCHRPKKKKEIPWHLIFWSQHKNWCHEFFVSHLHWVDLTLNALDTFFRGSQLSLFSGQQLSNLLGFIFVLFQVLELRLAGFNNAGLLQPQCPQGLQYLNVPSSKAFGYFQAFSCDATLICVKDNIRNVIWNSKEKKLNGYKFSLIGF